MGLTPVRVRGRHWRHRKDPLIVASQLQASTSSPLLSQAVSLENRRRKRKIKKAKVTTPAMPTLQGLPQEILEIIFLYSMNISLPRASPSLGQKLSSKTIIMEFTMRSFFHTVDHKANIRCRKVTSDPQLQSDILSCRFFTYDFFLAYVQRAHETFIKLRGKAWENTGVPVLGVREFDELFAYRFTRIHYLAFANGFHVPEKLLHGPFTKDKASLLYVLVSINGEIDWTGSMAGEAAKSGIKEAVKEGNEHAVASLAVLLGVRKAISTDILRYAVVTCNCPINMMRHLLFNAQILAAETSQYTLDFYDSGLWAWANANGERGDVLKNMLRRADLFDLEFYFEEDADWTKIVGFPYGGARFDTRTGLNAVVREMLTILYSNYGRKITRTRRQITGQQVMTDTEALLLV